MTTPMTHQQITDVVYSQSNVYSWLSPADDAGMNDGSADGSVTNETGVYDGNPGGWIQADAGSVQLIHHVVIGYDYLTNLGANAGESWGPAALNGATLQGSTDGDNFTDILTIPDYASSGSQDGLLALAVDTDYRYIRVTAAGQWLALTEFQLWTVTEVPAYTAAVAYGGELATPCSIQALRNYLTQWDALCAGVESSAAVVTTDTSLSIAYPYPIVTDAAVLYNSQQRSYTLPTPCSVRRLRVGLARWDAARPGVEAQAMLSTTNITLTATFPA